MDYTICLFRLVEAGLLGSIIGMERDMHGRAAGLRTHMLVSIGAALFTLVSTNLQYAEGSNIGGDPGRVAAQVVTGIGFLGAGTILQTGVSVRGLTTAACLWIAAAIGMTCAVGMHAVAISITFMVVLFLVLLKNLEHRLHRNYQLKLNLITSDMPSMNEVSSYLNEMNDVKVVALKVSVHKEQNTVEAELTLDTDTFKNQSELSNDVLGRLEKKKKLLKSYSVDCEN